MNNDMVRARLSVPRERYREVGELCARFLDMAATATGRATFDNKRGEAEAAMAALHTSLFDVDRGLYAALLSLPGVMDNAVQRGVQTLLDNPHRGVALFDLPTETELIQRMTGNLPRQRQLKMFEALRTRNVNNARTKRTVLRTILNAENLDWMVIKYRQKVKGALTHAFGRRRASIIRRILCHADQRMNSKEGGLLRDEIERYLLPTASVETVLQCVSFALGNNDSFNLDKLRSYVEARRNYAELSKLPPEVAEGFRGRFHRQRSKADVMEKTVERMTDKQKVRSVTRAEKAGVDIKLDVNRADPVDLLVMAFERGEMTSEVMQAIDKKAIEIARSLPYRYSRIAVVLDRSASMAGSGEQKWRPAAITLLYAAALQKMGRRASYAVYEAGGEYRNGLFYPAGETDLSLALLDALEERPEAIFVLTDGYENAPAGRFDEILRAARKLGYDMPVYQMTPTFAAEAYSTRRLSDEAVLVPISQNVRAMDLAQIKEMLRTDLITGVAMALTYADIELAPALPKRKEKRRVENQSERSAARL